MPLKHPLAFILFVLPLAVFAQQDSGWAVKDSYKNEGAKSIKGNLYINAGVGQSTILAAIYGFNNGSYGSPKGTSQSIVYNGTIDYGISRFMGVGVCAAYQTASGIAFGGYQGSFEYISRFNLAVRYLFDWSVGNHFELYCALRCGVSYWTDRLRPQSSYDSQPTLGANQLYRFSVQIPLGVKILFGPIGVHAELGLGTPYYAEGGLTCRIVMKKK